MVKGAHLRGKVALVTGASRGIGLAIAGALAREGAGVWLAARSPGPLEEAAAALAAGGACARAVQADVTREADVLALFERIDAAGQPIDILINNAGTGAFGPVAGASAGDLERTLAVNVRGTFLCSREALRRMAPRRSGTILSIGSSVGTRGYANQAIYGASKHAVLGFSRALAVEAHPHGVRVACVMPGGVRTDMIGDARPDLGAGDLLEPSDVAQAVLFLLSLSPRAWVDELHLRRAAGKPG